MLSELNVIDSAVVLLFSSVKLSHNDIRIVAPANAMVLHGPAI
jgi:hypothetical protein